MQESYISHQNPLFASADNAFRFELVLGDEIQAINGLDIAVTVYTSQLSPRLQVVSSSVTTPNDSNELPSEPTAYITRYDDHFIFVMTPEFQQELPTGILTFSIAYSKENFRVTNVIQTEKFINDLPA